MWTKKQIHDWEEQERAMTRSHGELEREHLNALKDPLYRLELRIQDLEDQLEVSPNYSEDEIPKEGKIIPKTEPKWTGKQWDTVKQLQGMVRHLESKVMEQRASKKKEEYLYK